MLTKVEIIDLNKKGLKREIIKLLVNINFLICKTSGRINFILAEEDKELISDILEWAKECEEEKEYINKLE